ncbi:MAG: hypothetical protein ROR55_09550 [Devosia sp.]
MDDVVAVLAATDEWAAGEYVATIVGGYLYRVASPAAEDHHVTTAGGVKLYVLPSTDGSYHSAAFGIVPGVDQSDAFNAFFTAVAGKRATIIRAATTYVGNNLRPKSGTHLLLESGVEITGKGDGSVRILSINTVDNVTVLGYGGKLTQPAADISHTLVINRAKSIHIEGLEIEGPGLPDIHDSDCIYIGGDPNNNDVSEDVTIWNVLAYGARRNILSVAGGHRVHIGWCEFHTTVDGTFKKGIDLEANKWMADGRPPVQDITIDKTYIHDTLSDGIAIIWADRVTIRDTKIERSGAHGVNITPGPHFHSADRNPRPGDSLGVSTIDDTTGWITVSTDPAGRVMTDYGILPGDLVVISTNGSGAIPSELSGYLFVAEISSDQTQIRVTDNSDAGLITSLSSAGSGTLNDDPTVSEVVAKVYRDGAASNVMIDNLRVSGSEGHDMRFSVARKIRVFNSEMNPRGSSSNGVAAQLSSDVTISNNRAYGQGTGNKGVNFDRVWGARTRDNTMTGFLREGLSAISANGAELHGDHCYACGENSTYNAAFIVDKSRGARCRRPSEMGRTRHRVASTCKLAPTHAWSPARPARMPAPTTRRRYRTVKPATA